MVEKEQFNRGMLEDKITNLERQEKAAQSRRSKINTIVATTLITAAVTTIAIHDMIRRPAPIQRAPIVITSNVIVVSENKFDKNNQYIIPKTELTRTIIEVKNSEVSPTRLRFDQNGNVKQEFDIQVNGKKKTIADGQGYQNIYTVGMSYPSGGIVFSFEKQPDGSVKVTRKEFKSPIKK